MPASTPLMPQDNFIKAPRAAARAATAVCLDRPTNPGRVPTSDAQNFTAGGLVGSRVGLQRFFLSRLRVVQPAVALNMLNSTSPIPATTATPRRSIAGSLWLMALSLALVWSAAPTWASVQPMTEIELSLVTAQGSTTVESLNAQQFAAEVQAMGLRPFTAPLYTGVEVLKMLIEVDPIDVDVDLSDVFFRNNGGTQSKSMGHLEIRQIDFTGTTLWLWIDETPFAALQR